VSTTRELRQRYGAMRASATAVFEPFTRWEQLSFSPGGKRASPQYQVAWLLALVLLAQLLGLEHEGGSTLVVIGRHPLGHLHPATVKPSSLP
jgi:hypothetical protein